METKTALETKATPAKPRLLRRLLPPVLFTVGFFLVLEIALHIIYALRNAQVTAVPLPYVIGHDYGPLPPWTSNLMILAPDEDLIWRNRPNLRRRYVDIFSPVENEAERRSLLRRFWPALPSAWNHNPSWEMALNSEGFRGDEIPREKKAACRIVCLGDSWTFGMNVGQEQTYPRRLEALLRKAFPQGDFEVINLGVLGYSSYQGQELLRKKVLDLNPDVVLIGFAMNDVKVTGRSDKGFAAYEKSPALSDRALRLLRKSETFNLVGYLAQLAKFDPQPLDHYLKQKGGDKPAEEASEAEEKHEWTQWSRVPPADYEEHIREMIRLARGRGASVVLLYNELWKDGPYQRALEKVSASEGAPLVNSSSLLAAARRTLEQELERQLGLVPAESGELIPDKEVETVFRVYLGDLPVPRGVFIAGPRPQLGDAVPNKVALYDDGTHGDQKAGDGVWSYAARFRASANLHYVYTNSGAEGEWTGLDVPHIREIRIEAKDRGKRVYLPVETFGKIYMQADGWHPNAAGYELIARAVCEVLKQDEKVKGSGRR